MKLHANSKQAMSHTGYIGPGYNHDVFATMIRTEPTNECPLNRRLGTAAEYTLSISTSLLPACHVGNYTEENVPLKY